MTDDQIIKLDSGIDIGINALDLQYIYNLRKRMYTEKDLSGDEMRDIANRLFLICNDAVIITE